MNCTLTRGVVLLTTAAGATAAGATAAGATAAVRRRRAAPGIDANRLAGKTAAHLRKTRPSSG